MTGLLSEVRPTRVIRYAIGAGGWLPTGREAR
jgi:hypothetical protein